MAGKKTEFARLLLFASFALILLAASVSATCLEIGESCTLSDTCCFGGVPGTAVCNVLVGKCYRNSGCVADGAPNPNRYSCCSGVPTYTDAGYSGPWTCAACLNGTNPNDETFKFCYADSDCCSHQCISHACTACKSIDQPCTSQSECCGYYPKLFCTAQSPITAKTCKACLYDGIGSGCNSSADCCNPGSTCSDMGGTNYCCRAAGSSCSINSDCCTQQCTGGFCTNQPSPPNAPALRDAPAIMGLNPYPTSHTAVCIVNCPPSVIPPDTNPIPLNPVQMQYRWVRVSGGTTTYPYGWSTPGNSPYSQALDCTQLNCLIGDEISLQSRACNNQSICSTEANSQNTLVVTPRIIATPVLSPQSFIRGQSVACLGCAEEEYASYAWFSQAASGTGEPGLLSSWLSSMPDAFDCASNSYGHTCVTGDRFYVRAKWCPGYEPCTYSNYSAPAVFACSAIGEACTSAADCCNSKPCNPGGVCVTALTPPPLAPQPSPHIQSLLTPFYANGTAECTNCNSILPRAGAFLQYHWVYGGQSTQWGNSPPPPLDCSAYGCQAGSTVTFEMRACAIADPSVCSIFSHSNPLPVAYPPLPPVETIYVCGTENFTYIMLLSAFACVAMASMIALAYMGGEFFHSPRAITWAKTEAAQVFVSLVFVAVILFALAVLCQVKTGEINQMLGINYPATLSDGSRTLFEGAVMHLQYMGNAGIANMASLRYNLAAYEIRGTFQKYICEGTCLYTLSSHNEGTFSGESAKLALTNSLLSAATLSELSVIFQYFTLLYITKGLFVVLLPLAIVLRSIPFMRQFGGALMAIVIALYVFYPLMIVADAYIVPSFARAFVGSSMAQVQVRTASGPASDCQYITPPFSEITNPTTLATSTMLNCIPAPDGKTEQSLGGITVGQQLGLENYITSLDPGQPLEESIKFNTLIFLSTVFLPAFNFIVIAALTRELSRFLGEEADISRLGQMI